MCGEWQSEFPISNYTMLKPLNLQRRHIRDPSIIWRDAPWVHNRCTAVRIKLGANTRPEASLGSLQIECILIRYGNREKKVR